MFTEAAWNHPLIHEVVTGGQRASQVLFLSAWLGTCWRSHRGRARTLTLTEWFAVLLTTLTSGTVCSFPITHPWITRDCSAPLNQKEILTSKLNCRSKQAKEDFGKNVEEKKKKKNRCGRGGGEWGSLLVIKKKKNSNTTVSDGQGQWAKPFLQKVWNSSKCLPCPRL